MDNYTNKNKAKIYSERSYVTLIQMHFDVGKKEEEKKADVIRKRRTINLTLRWEYKKVCLKKLEV